MTLTRQFAIFLVALGVLLGSACNKNKPQLPTKMQAPTLAVDIPEQIPEEEVPEASQAPQQQTTAEEGAPKKTPPKHRNAKKPAQPLPQPAAANSATSTVAANHPPANPVVEAPALDTAINATVTSQLNRQKQMTSELLDSTEKDLKGLNHGLTHDEESMVTQIHSYIGQSRKATNDGDFERAYNLATKARLLADALIKK